MAEREVPRLLTYQEIASLRPAQAVWEERYFSGAQSSLYCIAVVVTADGCLSDSVGGRRPIAPDMLLPDNEGNLCRYWSGLPSPEQRMEAPWKKT